MSWMKYLFSELVRGYELKAFGFGLCCLVTTGLSKDIGVMYDYTFSKLANHQIRHQATQKVGCQPGDCM